MVCFRAGRVIVIFFCDGCSKIGRACSRQFCGAPPYSPESAEKRKAAETCSGLYALRVLPDKKITVSAGGASPAPTTRCQAQLLKSCLRMQRLAAKRERARSIRRCGLRWSEFGRLAEVQD